MRALVTGVSGFVGGHLCEHLVAEGDLVVGLSASGRWPAGLTHLGRRCGSSAATCSRSSEADLAELVAPQAARGDLSPGGAVESAASVADPRGTWALNLGGALNLLEAVKAAGLEPAAGDPGRARGSATATRRPSICRSGKTARCAPTTRIRPARPRPTCWASSITWRTAPTW